MEMGQMRNSPFQVQLRTSRLPPPQPVYEMFYPPQEGEPQSPYKTLGITVQISSDPTYDAEIFMCMSYPNQRLVPGLILTEIDGKSMANVPYQEVMKLIKSTKGPRPRLTWKPGNLVQQSMQPHVLEFTVQYPAKPGDRIQAVTPDGMAAGIPKRVEVIMGGNTDAHVGETYNTLLSRMIPIPVEESYGGGGGPEQPQQQASGRQAAIRTQTVGEMQLLQEMATIRAAIARGDTSREDELVALERMRLQVKKQGLKSEMNILRQSTGSMQQQQQQQDQQKQMRLQQLQDELRQVEADARTNQHQVQQVGERLRTS